MNERIRQLAKQATKEVWGNDPFNGAPTFEGHELDEEKFAELIVRECADAIIKDGRLNDVRSAAYGCVRTIKEHFGVE